MQHLDIGLDRDELARRFGGGLPRGALCLVEGQSGTGKSILSQRLTYGLLAHGHDVAYVSTEFTTPAFLHQMDQLGYPVMDAFLEKRLKFIPTTPLIGHPVEGHELLPRLLAARTLLREPVVVLDTFSHVAEPHVAGVGGPRILEHLIRALKQVTALGTTLILTLDPDHLVGVDTSPLMGAADIRLQATLERVGGQVNRFITVRKFARAGGIVGDLVPFRVEPGAGFIVEIKAVA